MAAALIPLAVALAPELVNLIVSLVHQKAPLAEAQLGSGTGPVKFAQVFGDVVLALGNAAKAGQISKALPADETIQLIIQAAVQSMKLSGLLTAPVDVAAIAAAPSSQTIALTAGMRLLVVAG